MRHASVTFHAAFLAALLMALALAGCGNTKSCREKLKVDGPEYQYEPNTVRFTSPDVAVELSYLSLENLGVYFSMYKDGRYRNPFPSGPYIVMSMTIENRTEKRLLTFDPRRMELYPPGGDPTFAIDYTSLYTDLEILKVGDVEERMEVYRAVALDSTLAVDPGGKVRGLVVFTRPKEMKEGPVMVVADRIYLDHEAVSVPFLFEGGMPL